MKEKLLEIINVIRHYKDLETLQDINNETDLRNDLGLDSLDLAELTVRIESEFGVDVFEDGIIHTFGELINNLNKYNNNGH